jgi:uncharacterized membrane protein YccF (DUF307 family)
MKHLFINVGPKMSGDFIEGMWEMLIALAIAAAICVSMISLSIHLNETRIARASAVETAQAAAAILRSSPAKAAASEFN